MKRTSILMVIIGLVILGGIYWFLQKSNSKNQTNNSQSTTSSGQQSTVQNIVVNYDSTKPFTAQTYQVQQGQQVALKVTSGIADELHFHGYDLHTDLDSGKQGEIDFTADKTGRFEFELESHKTTLGEIEVYPK